MKVTCSACNASYNLPDEKVAGRRVKVRCKKCSEPIIVDGSVVPVPPPAPEEEDEATRVMASPFDANAAMWTVNLSETEQGDMTDEELVAAWQAGILTEDAYVWREGMDDWKPLLDVPEIISLLSQALPPEPPEAAAPPAAIEPSKPETPAPEPAKPAVKAEPTKAAPLAPKPHALSPTPSPAVAKSPVAAKSPAVATPSAPKAAVVARVTSRSNADLFAQKPKPQREKPKYEAAEARNENSVLFSLEALKAAAGKPEEAPPASARLDEDLLTMGNLGGLDTSFTPLIQVEAPAAPVVQPQAARGKPSLGAMAGAPDSMQFQKKRGGIGGIVIAVVLTAAVAGGGMFAYQQMNAKETALATTATPEPTATPTATPEATPEKAESETAAAASATAPGKPGSASQAGGTRPSTAATPRESTSPGTPGATKPPSADKPGTSKPAEPEKPPAAETSNAPPFNTEAAKTALGDAAGQVGSCKTSDGPTGSGKVQVTFAPSGRVTSANVVGPPFAGTPVGGCIARTFRQSRVPAFSGDPVSVSRSFSLQ